MCLKSSIDARASNLILHKNKRKCSVFRIIEVRIILAVGGNMYAP